MPKCPNCRETWAIKMVGKNKYTCSSGTCIRKDRRGKEAPFYFSIGQTIRPNPRRNEWQIREGYSWE